MKLFFNFVLYKTPEKEVLRLKREVQALGFSDYKIHFFDNSHNGKGFAYGANKGICAALKEKADLIVLANPDISFYAGKDNPRVVPTYNDFIETSKHFDIFSFAMKQGGQLYYGGEVDRWRMSGGVISKKPKERFAECDFVSALMAIQREVIEKVGFLKEDYFLYYEDVEYCYRAKKLGFKVGIDSQHLYEHFESSKGSKLKNHYLFWNRVKFMREYGTLSQKSRELLRLPKTFFEIFTNNTRGV
ncbi:MAG: glycosyltransferase family 2 protein [Candidatus Roizmanbacteria bacterium]|nr:MAG: glycosyltransferase family 2 protein [Candidatus Roizmanbacteria bacterium]